MTPCAKTEKKVAVKGKAVVERVLKDLRCAARTGTHSQCGVHLDVPIAFDSRLSDDTSSFYCGPFVFAVNGGIQNGASPFGVRRVVNQLCFGDSEGPNGDTQRGCRVLYSTLKSFSAVVPPAGVTVQDLLNLMRNRHDSPEGDGERLSLMMFAVSCDDELIVESVRRLDSLSNAPEDHKNDGLLICVSSFSETVFDPRSSSTPRVVQPPLMLFVPSAALVRSIFSFRRLFDFASEYVDTVLRLLQGLPVLVVGKSVQNYLAETRAESGGSHDPRSSNTHPRKCSVNPIAEVPGLFAVLDFISEVEHEDITEELLSSAEYEWEVLARRSVAHFNRKFYYGVNKLGEEQGSDLGANQVHPKFYDSIRLRLSNLDPEAMTVTGSEPWPIPSDFVCDQLTVNHYSYDGESRKRRRVLPATIDDDDKVDDVEAACSEDTASTTSGVSTAPVKQGVSGIAHHVDAHSPFDDVIFVVCLGSHTVLEYKRFDQSTSSVGVFLPPRSLLMMTGESRYNWTHCIAENKVDFVSDLFPPLVRKDRTSLTWRLGRDAVRRPHKKSTCSCPPLCDADE